VPSGYDLGRNRLRTRCLHRDPLSDPLFLAVNPYQGEVGRRKLLARHDTDISELNPKLNAETAVIVMLETREGIENCEAIAAVDGIDVLLIGSGDLTTDLGIPGQVDHPRRRAAYERVAAACRTHKRVLGVGGIRHNTALQGELIGLGARFVIAGTDTNYVLAGARQDTAALRAIKID
jgi:2-keto-3-deoxy-L-rhamnonate aldolase RhmA